MKQILVNSKSVKKLAKPRLTNIREFKLRK
jgi:hypothetical protein